MLALFVKVPSLQWCSVYDRSAVFCEFQIFCRSRSTSAVCTSSLVTCVNRLYTKYVKIILLIQVSQSLKKMSLTVTLWVWLYMCAGIRPKR